MDDLVLDFVPAVCQPENGDLCAGFPLGNLCGFPGCLMTDVNGGAAGAFAVVGQHAGACGLLAAIVELQAAGEHIANLALIIHLAELAAILQHGDHGAGLALFDGLGAFGGFLPQGALAGVGGVDDGDLLALGNVGSEGQLVGGNLKLFAVVDDCGCGHTQLAKGYGGLLGFPGVLVGLRGLLGS